MQQAIETKFLSPANSHGSRVKAKAFAVGSIKADWADNLSADQNFAVAARELAKKYGWHGYWIAGGKADRTGNVYVKCPDFYTTPEHIREVSAGPEAIQRGEAFFIPREES